MLSRLGSSVVGRARVHLQAHPHERRRVREPSSPGAGATRTRPSPDGSSRRRASAAENSSSCSPTTSRRPTTGHRDDATGDTGSVEGLRRKAFAALMQAAEDARRRFAVAKAATMAEQALAIASGPLERCDGLGAGRHGGAERLPRRPRVRLLPRGRGPSSRACSPGPDGGRLASAPSASRAPMRWPGSMTQLPPEEEVRRYLDLGSRTPEMPTARSSYACCSHAPSSPTRSASGA